MRPRTVVAGAVIGAAAVVVVRTSRVVEEPHVDDRALHTPDLDGTEHQVVSHDDAQLVVHRTGPADGPVVVLAHCWTGSQQTWAPVTRRLVAAGCHVVRWDQRGHGRSVAGHKGHTLEGLADDLAAVLTELDLHDVVLAGHSMGGFTIQGLASFHHELFHERTRGVVLVATAAGGLQRSALALSPQLLAMTAVERAMERPGVGRLLVRGTFGRHAHPHHLDVTRDDFLATAGSVRVDFVRTFLTMDVRPSNSRIDVPSTVICGTRDTLTPVSLSRALAASIPGATLEVLGGYGHMLPYEAPDVVADAILEHTTLGADAATGVAAGAGVDG